jgi:hypothetical protein
MMPQQDDAKTKVQRPHESFDAPRDVVADPTLSRQEKAEALEALEQDARQLAVASGEGMSGGEPAELSEVLQAKEALDLPPTEFAYDVVLKDLEARQLEGNGDRAALARAIEALMAVVKRR